MSNIMAFLTMFSNVLFCIVLILCSYSLSDPSFVFTEYENTTGFDDSQQYTLPLLILLCSAQYVNAITGLEAAVTMAEETINGEKVAPLSLIKSVALSGVGSFFLGVAMLFACRNSFDVIFAGPSDAPEMNLFVLVFSRNSGVDSEMNTTPLQAVLLSILYTINNFGNGFNHFTVTTRIAYALARDNAFLGSSWMKIINPASNNPDKVTIVVFVIEALLCTVPLFSFTAFGDIEMLIAVGISIGWASPIVLRFYQ